MNHPISDLFKISTDSLNEMIDVNTIVGDKIEISSTITVIPISKVKCIFGTGGMDQGKVKTDGVYPFGGATGGSIFITPVAFLVCSDNEVKLLHLTDETHILEKIIDEVPSTIDSIKKIFNSKSEPVKVEISEKTSI